MPTKLHDQFCRCRTCKPPLVGRRPFSSTWWGRCMLFAMGATVVALAIAAIG